MASRSRNEAQASTSDGPKHQPTTCLHSNTVCCWYCLMDKLPKGRKDVLVRPASASLNRQQRGSRSRTALNSSTANGDLVAALGCRRDSNGSSANDECGSDDDLHEFARMQAELEKDQSWQLCGREHPKVQGQRVKLIEKTKHYYR